MLKRILSFLPAFLSVASPLFAALPTGPCDYLVVSDSGLLPQAQRLASLRQRLTPAVASHPCVAAMGDVYRAYPPTGLRWTSLRDYLSARNHSAPGELHFVALMGDASFEDGSSANRVPVFQQQIPSAIHFDANQMYYDTLSSDDAFTNFFDSVAFNDTLDPRFAIGRIPADLPEQVDAYLDKVEAYESAYPYGPRAFTFGYLSDDDLNAGAQDSLEPIFDLDEEHQQLWDALKTKPFVRRDLSIEFPLQPDGTKPGAKDSLLGIFNAGPARIYFIGHGSPNQLTGEKMFEVPKDLPRLGPKRLQPIVTMLACTTARFAAPGTVMGKDIVFLPNGALAWLGGTIPTFPTPNLEFGKRFDSAAATGGTLGAAVQAAKRISHFGQNTSAFVLLGDPGLSLRVPSLDLVPAPGSGAGRLVLAGAGAEGDSAYFQLVRIDSVPWNQVIAPGNIRQRDRNYARETVVAEGGAALGARGVDGRRPVPTARSPHPHRGGGDGAA